MFTPKDTLAVDYTFSEERFSGTPQSLNFQQVQLAYSHQLTGRVLFELAGGPDFILFHDYTPSVGNTLTWSLSGGVQYRLRRTSLGASYSRGTNAGSGVFFGSVSQTAGGSMSHEFSRFLVGAVNAGYSFSSSLAPTSGVTNQFKNWYVGVSVGRQLGRYAHLSFDYGAQQQPYNGICPVASCGTNRAVQTFGVALDVHVHPIAPVE
jgi:hypothetical protein